MSGEIRLAFFCQYAIVICYKRTKIVKKYKNYAKR